MQGGSALHDFGENQLVLILSGTAADHADFTTRMRAYIQGIYEHLSAIPDTGLYIAVGECQSSIAELYRSYGEARFVLHHAGWSEKTPILFHAEMETPPFTYYYPADEEMRLIQLVKQAIWMRPSAYYCRSRRRTDRSGNCRWLWRSFLLRSLAVP